MSIFTELMNNLFKHKKYVPQFLLLLYVTTLIFPKNIGSDLFNILPILDTSFFFVNYFISFHTFF